MNSGFFVLLIGSSSLGVLGCTCVLLRGLFGVGAVCCLRVEMCVWVWWWSVLVYICFFPNVSWYWVSVLVLTSVLVLMCSVLLPCFPGGVLVVIMLWLVCCTTFPCRRCCCTVTLFSLCVVGCFCCISCHFAVLILSSLLWVALFSCCTHVSLSCLCLLSVWCFSFLCFTWLCIAALLEAACWSGVGVKVRLLFLSWSLSVGGLGWGYCSFDFSTALKILFGFMLNSSFRWLLITYSL